MSVLKATRLTMATWPGASNAIRNWNPSPPTARRRSASHPTRVAVSGGRWPSVNVSTSAEGAASDCRIIRFSAVFLPQPFLSVVSIHEIEKGITLLEHKGAMTKAASLKAWLSGLVSTYDDKIIGFDAQAAVIGGRLEANAFAAGHDPGIADAVIAAAHELIIVTRNTKHFLPFGIAVFSPDEAPA